MKNADFFQNTCFKECSNMAVVLNFLVTLNLYEKQWLLVIIWNKKHSSKQVVSMMYTLEKDFFPAAFKDLWDVPFQTE